MFELIGLVTAYTIWFLPFIFIILLIEAIKTDDKKAKIAAAVIFQFLCSGLYITYLANLSN